MLAIPDSGSVYVLPGTMSGCQTGVTEPALSLTYFVAACHVADLLGSAKMLNLEGEFRRGVEDKRGGVDW
jgi:hypothetical protein